MLVITRDRQRDAIGARWDGPLVIQWADLTFEAVRGMALDAFYDGGRGPLCRTAGGDAAFGGREPLPAGFRALVWHRMPDAPLRKAGWDPGSVAGTLYAEADRAEMIAEYAQCELLGTWDRAEGWAVIPDIDAALSAMYVPHEVRMHEFTSQAQRAWQDSGEKGLIVQAAGRRIFGEGSAHLKGRD